MWEVSLPDRRRPSSWGPRPRGTLIIGSGEAQERISLPKEVARVLASKRRSGEVSPSSRTELLYLVGELSRRSASLRIERLIDRREYAADELRRKLGEDGYAQQVIEECVGRALSVGLVSDARFADSFIRSKVNAGWGMGRIERELRQRGIDVEGLGSWPYDYLDPDNELDRAVSLARTRRPGGRRPFEKLARFLCTRGFSASVARRAASIVVEEREGNDLVDF